MSFSITKYSYIRFLLFSVYEEITCQFPEASGIPLLKQILVNNFSNSDNLFRRLFVINKIRGLEKVCGYLMFVLKKLDAGLIKYDTVTSNLSVDKHFLVNEITVFFNLDKKVSERLNEKPKENVSIKIPQEFLLGNDLEVDKIDKEFTEENYSNIELELVGNENITNEEIIFTLPDEKEEELKSEKINENEKEIEIEQTEKINQVDVESKKEKLFSYVHQDARSQEKETESLPTPTEEKYSEKTVKAETSESTNEINSLYIEFEEKVINRNAKLRNAFNYLISESSELENDGIIDNIISLAREVESYSTQMTFEVIPSLYLIIKDYFICYQLGFLQQLNVGDLKMFLSYLDLVETLIKGEDLSGFDNIIDSIEEFKKQIACLKANQEEIKETNLERNDYCELAEDCLNYGEKESYRKIRENILYIKSVFDSMEQIESKYKIYEGLTSLSKIFPQLKEMVVEAKQINQINIARLAEATYIFIKFIQNYRINPFEKEVIEVLKYIIYNFKSLYLNKQTEDLNLFIKYLNNPTKIFENNDTK